MNEDWILDDRQKIISMLTAARIEKGISQQELADRIGTKRSNICRIESGAQNISLDMLLKISKALGKDVSVKLTDRQAPKESKYSLRLYDEELITFSLRAEGLTGVKARILSAKKDRKSVFPLDLFLSDEGIIKWLKARVLPRNRANADLILKSIGLSAGNVKGIIDKSFGLSLNDSYWVVPLGFEGTFKEYNLYENRFSSVLSLVAYTGVGQSHEAFTTSPELTTQGMLCKAWRFIEGDGIIYTKAAPKARPTPAASRTANSTPVRSPSTWGCTPSITIWRTGRTFWLPSAGSSPILTPPMSPSGGS